MQYTEYYSHMHVIPDIYILYHDRDQLFRSRSLASALVHIHCLQRSGLFAGRFKRLLHSK